MDRKIGYPPWEDVNPFFCSVHPCKDCSANAHCEVDHCVCDEGYEGNGETCTGKYC